MEIVQLQGQEREKIPTDRSIFLSSGALFESWPFRFIIRLSTAKQCVLLSCLVGMTANASYDLRKKVSYTMLDSVALLLTWCCVSAPWRCRPPSARSA